MNTNGWGGWSENGNSRPLSSARNDLDRIKFWGIGTRGTSFIKRGCKSHENAKPKYTRYFYFSFKMFNSYSYSPRKIEVTGKLKSTETRKIRLQFNSLFDPMLERKYQSNRAMVVTQHSSMRDNRNDGSK